MEVTKKKVKTNQQVRVRHGLSLTGKILGISIVPTLIMGIVLTFVGIRGIREGMQEEVFKALEAITTSVSAAYSAVDPGDYSLSASNELMKGNLNVTQDQELLDSFTEGNDKEVTLFYGDVRYATSLISQETGERILGTTADPEVYRKVAEQGETVHLSNIAVNNINYYACYMPMVNSDGNIVGMYFVGQPANSVDVFVKSKTTIVVVSLIVIGIAALVIIMFVAIRIKGGIIAAEGAIAKIAEGHLDVEIDKKGLDRSDELGDMVRGVHKLQQELTDVVSNIKNSVDVLNVEGNELSSMASQTSATSDEIGHAVEGISKGAVAQAGDVEGASARIDAIGDMISGIVASVSNLDKISGDMKTNGDKAMVIIDELATSNDDTMQAIEKIASRVNATNESAAKISEAIKLITSIAEETNLLSLNAAIEAARAGEQGRGFAVVAGQIQKLAEQSNESAGSIAETIKELLEDSENTVKVMDEVREIVDKQQEKFEQTRHQFSNVHVGIDQSRDEAEEIKLKTDACNEEKISVVEIISNLSAISQENAASSQQTTASMEELNATINILANSAGNLQNLSSELQKSVEVFKL